MKRASACSSATTSTTASGGDTPRSPGLVRAVCDVPGNFIAEGQVFIVVAVCSYNPDIVHLLERDVVSFQIVDRSEGDGVRGDYGGIWPGVVRPMLDWRIDQNTVASRPAASGPAIEVMNVVDKS